ncbi:MAG: imidazolonepropionase [Pseudomonadota bacterium]
MPDARPGHYKQTGAIVLEAGTIAYVGDEAAIPPSLAGVPRQSIEGRVVTPGLIDCHTHIIYGGSRAREFEMRLQGASYEDIMRAGGGIFSTVQATRAASDEELLASALSRLDRLIAEGVTTVEIKSGYGLDLETELRMLRVARSLEQRRPITVKTTFLGAHAIPNGMTGNEYLTKVCLPALEQAAGEGLVDAVDGFCEGIAFDPPQIERVFDCAVKLGLKVKLHAEQLSNQRGTVLASRYGALSADHLEYLCEDGVAAMAKAGVIAVLLPGAFYALGETRVPPVDALRESGVPIALATDSNPGSSPITSLLLAMNMGARFFGLTPQECLEAVTHNAARALGLEDRGRLAEGMRADLNIWDVTDPAELTYRIGDAPLKQRIVAGVRC